MEKSELLSIAESMSPLKDDEKFYRFAQTYIFGMKNRKSTCSDEFFEVVKYCSEHSSDSNVNYIMKLGGKHGANRIKIWCKLICENKELRTLELDELNYVMGCCARVAKINGNR